MTKNAMTIGLDLGDRFSHAYLLADPANDEGEERTRLATTPKAIGRYFQRLPPSRVVIEVGTHSRWVARSLQALGHEVIVANPRRVRLISENENKSDQLDPELLARLGRVDPKLLSPITHRTDRSHEVLCRIRARDGLVRARTRLVNQCRGVAKSFGFRLRGSSTRTFHNLKLPEQLIPVLGPLQLATAAITEQIRKYDRELEQLSQQIPESQLLRQVGGVGPVLSLAFIATLEDPSRFRHNRAVGAYLGLCPRRDQSGSADPQLPITKAGDPYLRRLLVNAAHQILGPHGHDSDLRHWGIQRASRGGKNAKKRAVIAVARKLAVLLLSLWKTSNTYEPERKKSQESM